MLSDPKDWHSPTLGVKFDRLSKAEAASLEVPSTEENIYAALLETNGDKAPGPNGFTMAIWQCSWDFVKGDTLSLFRDFHE